MEKNKANKEIIEHFKHKYQEYKIIEENKLKANQTLTMFRRERTAKGPKSKITQKLIIDETVSNKKQFNSRLEDRNIANMLLEDKAFNDSPKFKLPDTKEPLWVTRPIGKYVFFT